MNVRSNRLFPIVLSGVILNACTGHSQAPTPIDQRSSQGAPAPPPAPASSDPLVGSYALTLSLGSTCGAVPEGERTQRFTANVQRREDARYVVTLGDGRFLQGAICTGGSAGYAGIGCNQFFASRDIDIASFFLENNNDEAHGGHIVEQLSSGAWLEIIGGASGPLNSATNAIDASGTASVWYCPTSSAYPFPCSRFASCTTDLGLTFRRN
jgi:hypothetical protein